MRVKEFTSAEEQFVLLKKILNTTQNQIRDEHLIRGLTTSESWGETTLDFVKRLIDNTFSEIDESQSIPLVGFVDYGDPLKVPKPSRSEK